MVKRISFILLAITVITILLIGCDGERSVDVANVSVILDAPKFCKISPEQLKNIKGEPSEKERFIRTTKSNKTYPMESYKYKTKEGAGGLGSMDFHFVDDKLVEIMFFQPKDEYEKENKYKILKQYNIKVSESVKPTTDKKHELKYRHPNDTIQEFWAYEDIIVQITFDLKYSE